MNYHETPLPVCTGCNKQPRDLPEYTMMGFDEVVEPNGARDAVPIEGFDVNEYVRREEGTYNPRNGHFLCTSCYIDAGQPSSPTGWVAP